MNKIAVRVKAIDERDVVTYIRVQNNETQINVIKTKVPEWLSVGDEVYCSFQEASVCVSKECPGRVSIENRIPGKLASTRNGGSLCELTFDSDIGQVVSLITSHAYENLGLEEGCDATILLRGVDIQLEPMLVPLQKDWLEEIYSRMKDAN